MKAVALAAALLALAAAPARAIDWSPWSPEEKKEPAWREFDAPASDDEMTALGVDADLAEMMRNRSGGLATLLRGRADATPIGLQWPIDSAASVALVRQLRDGLAGRGFVVFVADRNYGTGPDHVGLVQEKEPEVVVAKRVLPPEMSLDDWQMRLRAWRKQAAWDLVGVGSDWLEIEFREPLLDPDHWVDEFSLVAPASIAGSGGRAALREALVRTRRAPLWWTKPAAPARD